MKADKTIRAIGRWLAALNYACAAGDLSPQERAEIVGLALDEQPGGWKSDEAWVSYVEGVVKRAGVDPKIHRFRGFTSPR